MRARRGRGRGARRRGRGAHLGPTASPSLCVQLHQRTSPEQSSARPSPGRARASRRRQQALARRHLARRVAQRRQQHDAHSQDRHSALELLDSGALRCPSCPVPVQALSLPGSSRWGGERGALTSARRRSYIERAALTLCLLFAATRTPASPRHLPRSPRPLPHLVRRPLPAPSRLTSPAMKFMLDDMEFIFPYDKMYPEQYNYVCDLKRSLDAHGHCVLEMPSGTGKTVSLLSLIVAYQYVRPRSRFSACRRLELTPALPPAARAQDGPTRAQAHLLLAHRARDREGSRRAQAPHAVPVRSLSHLMLFSLAPRADLSDLPPPPSSLRRSEVYGIDDGDFLGLGLSSRKNLCIHPSVRQEKKGKAVDARCRDMTSAVAKQRHEQDPGSVELCSFHEVRRRSLKSSLPSLRASDLTRSSCRTSASSTRTTSCRTAFTRSRTSRRTVRSTASAPTLPFGAWCVRSLSRRAPPLAGPGRRTSCTVRPTELTQPLLSLAVHPRERHHLLVPLLARSKSRRASLEAHEQGLDRRLRRGAQHRCVSPCIHTRTSSPRSLSGLRGARRR